MMQIDWWSWKCTRCDFKAINAMTVNNHQCIAEAIVHSHIKEHESTPSAPLAASSPQRDRLIRWLRDCQELLAEPDEVPELEALIASLAASSSPADVSAKISLLRHELRTDGPDTRRCEIMLDEIIELFLQRCEALRASSPAPRPDDWLDGEIELTTFALAHPDCDVRAVLRGFADWMQTGSSSAWEPIGRTQPEDGQACLVWRKWPGRMSVNKFERRQIGWTWEGLYGWDPTHWMPLPPAPMEPT